MKAVLLIGLGTLDPRGIEEYRQFTKLLQRSLDVLIQPCFIELTDPPLIDGILACVQRGADQIIALPMLFGVPVHKEVEIISMLDWAIKTHPQIQFRYAAPLGAQPALLEALADRAAEAAALNTALSATETAVLLVGHSEPNELENNGEIARIARLLFERCSYGWVEYAFVGMSSPDLREGIERCRRLGAHRVIVLPYVLARDRICRFISEQAAQIQLRYADMLIVAAKHLGPHPGMIDALQQRYNEAVDRETLPRRLDHDHGSSAARSILPPRYQGNGSVSAAPMAAAELVYDNEGQVAWDRMWGVDDPSSPFCELALAGGPPHRGDLLEPVSVESVQADWEGYTRVVMELLRGIDMTTGLKGVMSRASGWIGVQCESDEMAIWLLRAIVVENISVRREGSVLFLPAGPAFRLEYEIKNVITVLAKTHHYWKGHLLALRG